MSSNLNTFENKTLENLVNLNLARATDLHKRLKINGAPPKAVSFIISVLEIYFKKSISDSDLLKSITEGHGDKNFDAIFIKGKNVYIFDISEENPKNEELFQFASGIEEFICKKPGIKSLNNINSRLKLALEELHKIKNPNIKVIIARKSFIERGKLKPGFDRIDIATKSASGITWKYLNSHSLCSFLYEPEEYLPKYTFEISDDDFLGPRKKSSEYFLKIPLVQLLNLKKECDNQNKNLFNKNIRGFIGENKISKQMISVIEKEPHNFHVFHNGITLVSTDSIKHNPGPKFEVYSPQIVNGCQTISSIYKAYESNLDAKELKTAHILVKAIQADSVLADKICQTSNTQTTIKPWDLRSNDDIQKQIEYYMNNVSLNNYFYKRKIDKKSSFGREVIRLSEFTQWVYAARFQDPAIAKNDKAALFDNSEISSLYNRIKGVINPKLVDEISKIGIVVRNYIKNAPKGSKGLLRDSSLQIIASLYEIKDFDGVKLSEIENTIHKLVKNIREQNPDISNNKIFTKKFLYRKKGSKNDEEMTMWKLLSLNLK